MTSLWQLKRFEARISLFKSLDCPLALAAAGMNQRFTRYPPVINHNLGWCNLPTPFRVTSLALGQSYDCPSVSEVTLKDMGNDSYESTKPWKCTNHNKTKQNKKLLKHDHIPRWMMYKLEHISKFTLHSGVACASWRLKSPTANQVDCLFNSLFGPTTRRPSTLRITRENPPDTEVFPTKGQQCGKYFHVIMPSWDGRLYIIQIFVLPGSPLATPKHWRKHNGYNTYIHTQKIGIDYTRFGRHQYQSILCVMVQWCNNNACPTNDNGDAYKHQRTMWPLVQHTFRWLTIHLRR